MPRRETLFKSWITVLRVRPWRPNAVSFVPSVEAARFRSPARRTFKVIDSRSRASLPALMVTAPSSKNSADRRIGHTNLVSNSAGNCLSWVPEKFLPRSVKAVLNGKTIVITRAASQSADLRNRLEDLGARVIECPTIQIVPPTSWKPVDNAIRRLQTYQWLLFTSANAVEQFMDRMGDQRPTIPIAVVGSATAAKLNRWGLQPSLVPSE